jgi:hypothetical protein
MCDQCESWPALCCAEIFPADRQGPAEWCSEDAAEGSDYCAAHDPLLGEPDWDDRRKDTAHDCE